MTLLYLASSGTTKTELQDGLSYPSEEEIILMGFEEVLAKTKSSEAFTLETGSKLYVKKEFPALQDYQDKISKYLLSEIENIDFSSGGAAKVINQWVADKTKEKIKEIISEADTSEDTVAVLVNAIYFKSKWENEFSKEGTHEQEFSLLSGKTVKVQMMQRKGEYALLKHEALSCSVLEMPYKKKRLSMIIFLPEKAEDFLKMEKTFFTFDFSSLQSCQKQTLHLSVPKFSLSTTNDELVKSLQKMAISHIFGKADFSRLTNKTGLFVSTIIQKVFVELNEEGTEAAAATMAFKFYMRRLIVPV